MIEWFKWNIWPTYHKCIVRHCPNWSDEGKFEGRLCLPCADALRGSFATEHACGYIEASLAWVSGRRVR